MAVLSFGSNPDIGYRALKPAQKWQRFISNDACRKISHEV
jgi:hypothetical protein